MTIGAQISLDAFTLHLFIGLTHFDAKIGFLDCEGDSNDFNFIVSA